MAPQALPTSRFVATQIPRDCYPGYALNTQQPSTRQHTLSPTAPAFTPTLSGTVIPVRGDGDCCFHLAGVIGALPDSLINGVTRCSKQDLEEARNRISKNFISWRGHIAEFFPGAPLQEIESEGVSSILGCDSETFLSRARGEAKGQDRLGSIYELSLHLYESDMEVVLIDADRITSYAPLHTLQQEPYTISHEMIGASPSLGWCVPCCGTITSIWERCRVLRAPTWYSARGLSGRPPTF